MEKGTPPLILNEFDGTATVDAIERWTLEVSTFPAKALTWRYPASYSLARST
jgi:hypothetical protein